MRLFLFISLINCRTRWWWKLETLLCSFIFLTWSRRDKLRRRSSVYFKVCAGRIQRIVLSRLERLQRPDPLVLSPSSKITWLNIVPITSMTSLGITLQDNYVDASFRLQNVDFVDDPSNFQFIRKHQCERPLTARAYKPVIRNVRNDVYCRPTWSLFEK